MDGHWYDAYGLKIRSQVPLPVPQSQPGSADIVVRYGKIDAEPPGINGSRSILRAGPDEVCFLWQDMGKVIVRGGREIIVDPRDGADTNTVAPWIQGASLSLVLHQRGFLIMHASSVAIGDEAVAFIGEVGWGKSTTAAAMHARGHQLLADDIVAIQRDETGRPMVVAGFPHLKLTAQAVSYMGEDPTALSHVIDDQQKLLRVSRSDVPDHPLPLAAVFVLGEGDSCRVEPLTPLRAMPELMRHAFVARMTHFLKRTDTEKTHFENCTQVIRHASVCRLLRPKSFDLLGTLAELVEDHISARCAREGA